MIIKTSPTYMVINEPPASPTIAAILTTFLPNDESNFYLINTVIMLLYPYYNNILYYTILSLLLLSKLLVEDVEAVLLASLVDNFLVVVLVDLAGLFLKVFKLLSVLAYLSIIFFAIEVMIKLKIKRVFEKVEVYLHFY